MNGMNLDMSPMQLRQLVTNPSSVADMLLEEDPRTGESPAAIFADLINVQRLDIKRLADAFEVEVSVSQMTPERAAELLAGVIAGEGIEIVLVFNEMAEQRESILREVLGDDEYDEFEAAKKAAMFTDPDPDGDGEVSDE